MKYLCHIGAKVLQNQIISAAMFTWKSQRISRVFTLKGPHRSIAFWMSYLAQNL